MSIAAGLLLPVTLRDVAAASCNGASHETPTLTSGSASPGSGATSTVVTFSVRYTDRAGCAPSQVEVSVAGVGRFQLAGPADGYAAGATFTRSTKLPAGSWPYQFAATSGSGPGERTVMLTTVSPARVVIVSPTPKPTPKATPNATPKPTPKPTPKATPKPQPIATASNPVTPTPPSPDATGGPTTAVLPPSPSSPPQVAAGALVHRGGPTPPANRTGGRPVSAALLAPVGSELGIAPDPGALLPVAAWSLTTALGVLLFAFVLRRPAGDDEMAPARIVGWTPPRLPIVSAGPSPAAGTAEAADDDVPDPEANLPRWLRPSLRLQRQSGDLGLLPLPAEPVRFDRPAPAGVDRRTIAYRLVRLSDGPDDLRTNELARLDRGDEVEVLGGQGGFLKVRTPQGLEGWVPRVVIVG